MHRPDGSVVQQANETQVQAMQAKLAARVNRNQAVLAPSDAGIFTPTPRGSLPNSLGTSSTPQAAQSGVSPKSAAKLEWERPEEGAMAVKSKCKRYSVSKVSVMGRISYELWKLAGGGEWFNQLANQIESFAKAKQLADEDVNKC